MTSFSFTMDSGGQFSTSFQINSKAYALDYTVPTLEYLTTAVGDMQTTYTNTAGRPNKDTLRINLDGGALGCDFGSQTAPLTAGVYMFFGSGVIIADTIYSDGNADPNSVFVIQMMGNLVQYANIDVILVMVRLQRTSSGRSQAMLRRAQVRTWRASFWSTPKLHSLPSPP
jgi:hypothetical protein